MQELKGEEKVQLDEERFEANWNALDANSDGKVTFEELLKNVMEKAQKHGVIQE